MPTTRVIAAAAICVATLLSGVATAGVITLTDSPTGRSTFGGNDVVDWGGLGPTFAVVSNPFNINSAGGVGLTVSQSSGSFERRDQGSGWGGNFTDGNVLLWTQGDNAHPMTIAFNSAIRGVGFQINPNFSETLTHVEVFGAGNVLFQAFDVATNDRNQPSADFIGFTSDLIDITSITITQGTRSDFAINQLSLITDGGNPVPEPGTLALVALGLFAVSAARKRKG